MAAAGKAKAHGGRETHEVGLGALKARSAAVLGVGADEMSVVGISSRLQGRSSVAAGEAAAAVMAAELMTAELTTAATRPAAAIRAARPTC